MVNNYDQELIDIAKKNLRIYYDRCGETLYSLSRKSGLTENAINKVILGDSYPRLDTLVRICDAMGISPDILFKRELSETIDIENAEILRNYCGIGDPDLRAMVRHTARELKMYEIKGSQPAEQ